MTNKHKKSASKKVMKETKEVGEAPVVLEPGNTNFSRAQLAAFVFLSIGYSKIMEFSTAYKEGFENPISCIGYLGEANADTCTHPSFSSLILVKYYSGMSLAAYLLSGMILLWNSEHLFLKFMTCFTMSPVATSTFATIFNQRFLERGRVWHLLLVATVMFATIAPQNVEQIPFITDRQFNPKTLQSMTLIGLFAFSLWEVARVILNSENDLANSLIATSSSLPEAAKSLVNFWIVDKFSMSLVYAFALVHFPSPKQRAFLFFVTFIKAFEFFTQLSRMKEQYHDEWLVEAGTLTSAVASAVAWYY